MKVQILDEWWNLRQTIRGSRQSGSPQWFACVLTQVWLYFQYFRIIKKIIFPNLQLIFEILDYLTEKIDIPI